MRKCIKRITAMLLVFVIMLLEVPVLKVSASEEKGTNEFYISYVAVDKPYIQLSEKQSIVIGTEGENVELVELFYHNESTGKNYVSQVTETSDGGSLFEMEFEGQAQIGEYVLDSVNYKMESETYSINLQEIGIEAKFGVGIEVETTPDAQVVDENMPEESSDMVDMSVASFDENGNLTSDSSIEQVIANSENEIALQDGNEGVTSKSYKSNGNVVVVLDPGHDSKHAGASGNGLKEEELTLKIAQYCYNELTQYAGVTVYMTRTSSSCPYPSVSSSGDDNNARVNYAASVGADLYVSIHLNSSSSESANGVEIYYPNANYIPAANGVGSGAANAILTQLTTLGLNNRGTKIRNSENHTTYADGSLADYYAVIRNSKIKGFTGIIVEHAFLTNSSDAGNYLNSDEKIQSLGVADATGIANFYGLSKKSSAAADLTHYAPVFDADYYYEHNTDVANVCGKNTDALLQHFVNYGMQEGRQASENFNVYYYKNRYTDLEKTYGDDLKAYYLHYINYGKAEGRIAHKPTTVNNGVDYSAVYDYDYYLSQYSDLQNLYNGDDVALLNHFVNYGMGEGRQAISTFDVTSYYYQYDDLRRAYGSDLKSYYLHYINYGKKEGRAGTGCTSLQNGTTIYNGVDYSAVYNYDYYIANNPDVAQAYSNDEYKVLAHFINYGMSEGRQANSAFNVTFYYYQYADLRQAYGSDLKSYYLHYVNYGKSEGRQAHKPTTEKNGVDYSAVYNYDYYIANNPDVAQAYPNDDEKALEHFINYGMIEGRQAISTFNVISYAYQYADLRQAYGNNLALYYMHYINYGKKEGRKATGCNNIQNPVTSYNGVDYSDVYDYNYYMNTYSDLMNTYGINDTAALLHFINYGMNEARQAIPTFNVAVYRNNYADLREVYGDNLPAYYMHYINYGKGEGRKAV